VITKVFRSKNELRLKNQENFEFTVNGKNFEFTVNGKLNVNKQCNQCN